MSVVRKTLQENYIYFIKELTRIDEEISELPIGSISEKKSVNQRTIINSGGKAKR